MFSHMLIFIVNNIFNIGWLTVQYRLYCTQISYIGLGCASSNIAFFVQYNLYWTVNHPILYNIYIYIYKPSDVTHVSKTSLRHQSQGAAIPHKNWLCKGVRTGPGVRTFVARWFNVCISGYALGCFSNRTPGIMQWQSQVRSRPAVHVVRLLGLYSLRRRRLISIGIPIINLRRS